MLECHLPSSTLHAQGILCILCIWCILCITRIWCGHCKRVPTAPVLQEDMMRHTCLVLMPCWAVLMPCRGCLVCTLVSCKWDTHTVGAAFQKGDTACYSCPCFCAVGRSPWLQPYNCARALACVVCAHALGGRLSFTAAIRPSPGADIV